MSHLAFLGFFLDSSSSILSVIFVRQKHLLLANLLLLCHVVVVNYQLICNYETRGKTTVSPSYTPLSHCACCPLFATGMDEHGAQGAKKAQPL